MKYTNEKQLDQITDSILESLPHGSGINGEWLCETKEDSLVFSNDYSAMSNGYYCHTIRFWIVIPLINGSIQFDKWELSSDAEEQEETPIESSFEGESCGCLFDIDSYLEDTFAEYFDELKKYILVVDLNERGQFSAHVENKIIDSLIVFEYSTDEDDNDLVLDGFIKWYLDYESITKHLQDVRILGFSEYIESVRP